MRPGGKRPGDGTAGHGPAGCRAVALLGALRRDKSHRISAVEPYFASGDLLIGVMASSAKAADLRRDQRYVLHSAVTGPDAGERELKLSGIASTSTAGKLPVPAVERPEEDLP